MNSETMIVLDYVHALQTAWNIDDRTPPCKRGTKPVREPAYQRLVHHIGSIASRVPNRRQMVDWFGRRLITWGWHLRMRYGSCDRL